LPFQRHHYFAGFLAAWDFLAFSKSSVVGASGSDGLRMCSLLPCAMRSCFALILAYRLGLAVVIGFPFFRFVKRETAPLLEWPQQRVRLFASCLSASVRWPTQMHQRHFFTAPAAVARDPMRLAFRLAVERHPGATIAAEMAQQIKDFCRCRSAPPSC